MVKKYGTSKDNTLIGGATKDYLSGRKGDDTLIGGAGSDTLIGGAAKDYLVGGKGNDTLTGGTEADVFYFMSPLDGIDSITDFSEKDKIELDEIVFGGFLGIDSLEQFSYDNKTGALSVDINPSDKIAPIQFASLPPNLSKAFDPVENIVFENQDITSVIYDSGATFSGNGDITINGDSII